MAHHAAIISSINNVRHLIKNAILLLRDLDAILSKQGFYPINENVLGTESSKSINQSMNQSNTLFPQYIARQYALQGEIDTQKVSKIIFINIQFYNYNKEEIPPTLVCSVMILPEVVGDVKSSVENWWLQYTVYNDVGWDKVKKNGELNINDEQSYRTLFWCRDLLTVHGQKELLEEVKRLVDLFHASDRNDQI